MSAFTAPSPLRPFLASPPLSAAATTRRRPLSRRSRTPSSTSHTRLSRPHRFTPPCATLSDVLIIGANRGLGLSLAKHLHALRVANLATTRRAASAPVPAALAAVSHAVHELDVVQRDAVLALVARVAPRVVISCVGGDVAGGRDGAPLPDLCGTRNLVDACVRARVRRFVYVSALGAGDSEGSVPMQVMDTMRPLLLEKSHAEVYVRGSGLEATVVRPGPLVEEGITGEWIVTEGTQCYGTVTREDLAVAIAHVAGSERAVGKTLHVVDRTKVLVTSPYVRPLEFWERLPFEAFQL